MLTNTPSDLH